jgi:hypothetical protein
MLRMLVISSMIVGRLVGRKDDMGLLLLLLQLLLLTVILLIGGQCCFVTVSILIRRQ